MQLTKGDFIGVWVTEDVLPYWSYKDGIVVTLYAGEKLILWTTNNESVLVEGDFEIENIENDIFYIRIDGNALAEEYLNIKGRMFMKDKTPSFVLDIPGYGERYLKKIRN